MQDKLNSIASPAEATNIVDSSTENKTLSAHEQLGRMQQEHLFTGQLAPKPESRLDLLKAKIPFFAGFLDRASGFGKSVCKIAQIQSHHPSTLREIGSGLHYTQIALTLIDFLRIPSIYLGAYIAGEKAPISLSKNAQWGYSAVLLGLTLTALLVPVVATPIALTMASLGLSISLFSLGKMMYQRHKIKKNLRQVEQDIHQARQELDEIQQQAQTLESSLRSHALSEEAKTQTLSEIDALYQRYSACVTQLQNLHNTQLQQQTKLKKIGSGAFMNKGVSIALSSVAMIGLVLTLFFPPIGLGIIAASAGMGILYTVGRIAAPRLAPPIRRLVSRLHSWFSRYFGNDKQDGLQTELTAQNNMAVQDTAEAPAKIPTSTMPKIIQKLSDTDRAEPLDAPGKQDKETLTCANALSDALHRGEPQRLLQVLQTVTEELHEKAKTPEQVSALFERCTDMEQTTHSLKAALNQIPNLSASEKESLRAAKNTLQHILSAISPELAHHINLERLLQAVPDEKSTSDNQEKRHNTHGSML